MSTSLFTKLLYLDILFFFFLAWFNIDQNISKLLAEAEYDTKRFIDREGCYPLERQTRLRPTTLFWICIISHFLSEPKSLSELFLYSFTVCPSSSLFYIFVINCNHMNNLKINKFIAFERLTAVSLIAAVLNDEQRLLRNLFQNYSKSSRPVLKRNSQVVVIFRAKLKQIIDLVSRNE